jgi:Prokaryotic N-terminal methylation motif
MTSVPWIEIYNCRCDETRLLTASRGAKRGFTLIELLVVVAK